MSRLSDAIAAGRFVVTAELLTVNSGGLAAVHRNFEPFEDYVDAVILTARSGRTTGRSLRAAAEQLSPRKLLGLILLDA